MYSGIRRVGSGGMAEVLLAVPCLGNSDVQDLVILKRILPHLKNDPHFVECFLREAKVAASLRHPNIVGIREVVQENGEFSIVMEYLSGEDLSFLLAQRNGKFPVEVACSIVHSVARALAWAHTPAPEEGRPSGIVHRDVSPSNIMVTYDGEVKVIDFGLAKMVNTENSNPGHIKGKLPYASPEYVREGVTTAQSDLFSLGTVFHELLTSKRLFDGPSQGTIMHKVLERHIPPPSVYNPDVGPFLDDIVMGLLERDPEKRTATTSDLCNQLAGVLNAENDAASAADEKKLVGDWMKSHFSERWTERLLLEREVASCASAPTEIVEAFGGVGGGRDSAMVKTIESVGATYSAGLSGTPLSPHSSGITRSKKLPLLLATALIAVVGVGVLAKDTLKGNNDSEPKIHSSVVKRQHNAVVEPVATLDREVADTVANTDPIEQPAESASEANEPTPAEIPAASALSVQPSPAEPQMERRPRQKVKNVAKQRYGHLSVTVRPPRAQVIVDGKQKLGKKSQKLTVGRHDLTITAPGYVTRERTVVITAGNKQGLEIVLEKETPKFAELNVFSEPSGGTVTVDGERLGRTPIRGAQVGHGKKVRIVVTKSGYRPWGQSRSFLGSANDLEIVLEPIPKAVKPDKVREPVVIVPVKPPEPKAAPRTPPATVKVSSSSMTRISGTTPVVVVPGQKATATAPVVICVDTKGNVEKVRVPELPVALRKPIAAVVGTWRYKVHLNDGVPTPACFSDRIRFKIRGR